MKRLRELPGGGVELSPVRLLGGFVCVDLHVGCSGCRYCLNRRDALLDRLLESGVHLDLADAGISTSEILEVAASTWSFARAGLAVRCGHLTDWRFQVEGTAELVRSLPPGRPVVVMTRYPLSPEQAELVQGQRNLLVHISLTPRQAPESVLASVAGLPPENLFFMCRPLFAGERAANEALVDLLPVGAHAGLRKLNTDGIPGIADLASAPPAEIDDLIARARARGVRVLDYFGCALWSRLERPFFKHLGAARSPTSACPTCPNRAVCAAPRPGGAVQRVEALAEELLIPVDNIADEADGSIRVRTPVQTGRAEEVYLSELLGRPVRLSTVARADAPGKRTLGDAVLSRWERSGFAPVARMRDLAARVLSRALPAAARTGSART